MSNVQRCKDWKGNALQGEWEVTFKLDGVRALRRNGRIVSRAMKPLYNIPSDYMQSDDAEIFCGSLGKTTSRVCASKKIEPIERKHVFSLQPLDPRLKMTRVEDPEPDYIRKLLRLAVKAGAEGIVLRQGNVWLKLKETKTYDVRVTAIKPGKGKHKGTMGALITTKGRVGGGYTDKLREKLNDASIIGKVIEVECQTLTEKGKFRHARFLRVRFDK